jgi:hypothetical protein
MARKLHGAVRAAEVTIYSARRLTARLTWTRAAGWAATREQVLGRVIEAADALLTASKTLTVRRDVPLPAEDAGAWEQWLHGLAFAAHRDRGVAYCPLPDIGRPCPAPRSRIDGSECSIPTTSI